MSFSEQAAMEEEGAQRREPPGAANWAYYFLFTCGLLTASVFFGALPLRFADWTQDLWNQPWPACLAAAGPAFLLVLCVILAIRWFALFSLSMTTHVRSHRRPPHNITRWPLVSIFVPAYNESETIEAALSSLLNLDYPRYEVLVIDDGSADDTYEKAIRFAGHYGQCKVRAFRKINGGKWSAHNFAFHRSRGELVLCLDADSRIEPHSLRLLVEHLVNPQVGGVAGQIRVRNRCNVLTMLQALEYVIANGSLRMSQSLTGTVLVVPGPIGLFRRDVLEEVYLRYGSDLTDELKEGEYAGPFEGDTFAEDFDLSVAVLSLGHKIAYEPRAVSHTKAPRTMASLLNQRYRWYRGSIQVLRKFFRRAWRLPQMLQLHLVAWLVATYLLELVTLPVAYVTSFLIIGYSLSFGSNGSTLLMGFAIVALLNVISGMLFAAMHRDRLSVVAVVPLYDLYHGLLLSSSWFISVFDELRGTKMRW